MTETPGRLRQRAAGIVHNQDATRVVVLLVVATIVLLKIGSDVLATYFLLSSQIAQYRASLIISMGLSTVINIVLVLLVWILFETLSRVEREADRLQTFMDNVYRRTLR